MTDADAIAATLPPLPGEATFVDALRLVREALPGEHVAEALLLRSVALLRAAEAN